MIERIRGKLRGESKGGLVEMIKWIKGKIKRLK